jgi:hypothetical protein
MRQSVCGLSDTSKRGFAVMVAALTLIAVGVLLTVRALVPPSWDFAVAVTRSWHVVVWPAPLWVGVLVTLFGLGALYASIQSR